MKGSNGRRLIDDGRSSENYFDVFFRDLFDQLPEVLQALSARVLQIPGEFDG